MTNNNDNHSGFADRSSLVAERQNAVIVIESLRQLYKRCCNACPKFVVGPIKDALALAFYSRVIKNRRPLLIYIHHNKSSSIDKFCLDIFCSEFLIEYLHENYIVWPWDITNESNRKILIKIWEDNFPHECFINFSVDQCPMLIGIMQRTSTENDSFSSLKYESKILLIGNYLVRTAEQLNLETLLSQLIIFKEECDENERCLPFNFIQQTGLCQAIILEIAEYLSLNDAVTTFSIDILPLLWKYNRKLPVREPSAEFMKTMIQKKKHEYIISLRFAAAHFKQTMELASANTFDNVIVLTLNNLQNAKQIFDMHRYFPNSTRFSIRYDKEVDFRILSKIFNLIPNSIKQFEIHCDSILCSHHRPDLLFTKMNHFNETIEYFVLHVDHTFLSLVNNCVQYYNKCILMTITDFIKIMSNIRYIRVIINKVNVETLLEDIEWTGLAKMCKKLEEITLKVIKNTSSDTQLAQKIQEIENGLHRIRQSIKFEVKIKSN